MGTIRVQERLCNREIIDYEHIRHVQDISDQNAGNLIGDLGGGGVISATLAPSSGIGVSISNFLGQSTLGEHLKKTSASTVDLTSNVPTSGYRWVSIFATFSWTYSLYTPDGTGSSDYHARTEGVTYSAVNGTSTALGANPGSGAIRVCSMRLHHTTSVITAGMINTTLDMSDILKTNADLMPFTGGDFSDIVTYNGKPLVYANNGQASFGAASGPILGVGDADYDNHYYCMTPLINSGIVHNSLMILPSTRVAFYWSGSEVQKWWNVIQHRMSNDQVSNAKSSAIIIYMEEDANGSYTGKFQIIVFGSQNMVNRFANHLVRWTAIAAMPLSGITL